MHYFEIIESIIELCFIYSILVLIDNRNTIKASKLIVLFVLLTASLIIMNKFNVPYYMAFTTLLCFVGFGIAIRKNLVAYLSDLLLTYCIGAVLQQPVLLISHLTQNGEFQSISRAVMIIFLIVVIVILIKKKIFHSIFVKYYHPYRIRILISLAIIITLMSILSNVWNNSPSFFIDNQGIFILIMALFIAFLCVVIKSIVDQNKERETGARVLQYGYVQDKTIEEFKAKEHDMDANLQSIYNIVSKSNDNKNKRELQSFIERQKLPKVDISHIGPNTTISALLNDKREYGLLLKVALEYSLTESEIYQVPERDLERILSNLINNAIEYTAKINSQGVKRVVTVEFKKTTIIITNPLEGGFDISQIEAFRTKGFSTKGEDRGYGLTSVEKLTENNNLLFDLDVDETTSIINATVSCIGNDATPQLEQ